MKLNEHFFAAAACGSSVVAALIWGDPQYSPILYKVVVTTASVLTGYSFHAGITHSKERNHRETEARKEYEEVMADAIERRAAEMDSKPGLFP